MKEVCLLGQNVNSYHDLSPSSKEKFKEVTYTSALGFKNMYKSRDGPGARFADLLDEVSSIDPEMRIRFTSPHPKDFPDEVLYLVRDRVNICSSLHLPVQSGSNTVLERMRRGYTRETYIELVNNARKLIPNVSISSDFISGFCGETEDEHMDTIRLMEEIKFDQAYMYAYSLREKTHASHNYKDDVAEGTKQRRLQEVINTFRKSVQIKNDIEVVGTYQPVLIDGFATKSTTEFPRLSGRTDSNKRVLFDLKSIPTSTDNKNLIIPKQGDYVIVKISEARGHTLRGDAICCTTNASFRSFSMEKINAAQPLEAQLA